MFMEFLKKGGFGRLVLLNNLMVR